MANVGLAGPGCLWADFGPTFGFLWTDFGRDFGPTLGSLLATSQGLGPGPVDKSEGLGPGPVDKSERLGPGPGLGPAIVPWWIWSKGKVA